MNSNEMTIDNLKQDLKDKIAVLKIQLRGLNKELTKRENYPDAMSNKAEQIQEQIEKIKVVTREIEDLEEDLKDLKKTELDENEEGTRQALEKVRTEWIEKQPTGAYIINEQHFVFIKDYSTVPEKQNIQIGQYEPQRFCELLAKDLGLKSWNLPVPRLKHLFNECNRTFNFSRFSIDPSIWQRQDVYLPIQHMEPHFINQVKLTKEQLTEADTSLPFFDILMYSLSGGKKENQEHIERWILHKIINYRKAVTTPDLVIVGHVGGNGKGIIQAIIRLMLPAMLSGKANSKTLNGNFNAIMLGKLIVFFDDQNSREIPLEVVKQLAGSETMIFEPKGKDQYEGEKTHSSAWFSNTLPFKLTPAGQEGGVDRRFSIMATNITFLESIRRHYEQEFGHAMTVEESKDVAESIVGKFLLNRLSIARWFDHLKSKHPEIDETYTLKPLHGEDYHSFLENQRNSYDTIWHDLVTPVLKAGGCVPMFVVKELLRHMEGRIIADKTINAKFKQLSTENKLEIVSERLYIDIHPAVVNGKKQCSVFRCKDSNLFNDPTFNWGLVSNIPYSVPSIGRDLIAEDNLIFGIKIAVDDEDTMPDSVFNFDHTALHSEKSWEEM